ncbi:MAG: TIGR03668 family PPOX class F420-dependent oxidoreductase [Actinophytocola sp.]|uniref:TIGR03668 family PPOX class F420-dependent oxidoreductase n=1 Tax=Actinophytocola sp. TaxID=1872138 RepID=UPI0013243585|nr:TIGR03668 family PPOX class F420-dependent oxidoreductase [Actinophytocola sp.]MPZ81837.1 TIGR03668 family PPOX class F420-dependent oxidoreductase [Actinophytocola sp.]
MDVPAARARCAAARVARLATVDGGGRPHLVPVTFAVRGDVAAIAVDHKPKRTTELRRLANIESNDRVSVLVDHYDDQDWTRLWWVRADGTARVLRGDDRDEPIGWLVAKYPQYRARPPAGPVILIEVEVWRGWAAAG